MPALRGLEALRDRSICTPEKPTMTRTQRWASICSEDGDVLPQLIFQPKPSPTSGDSQLDTIFDTPVATPRGEIPAAPEVAMAFFGDALACSDDLLETEMSSAHDDDDAAFGDDEEDGSSDSEPELETAAISG